MPHSAPDSVPNSLSLVFPHHYVRYCFSICYHACALSYARTSVCARTRARDHELLRSRLLFAFLALGSQAPSPGPLAFHSATWLSSAKTGPLASRFATWLSSAKTRAACLTVRNLALKHQVCGHLLPGLQLGSQVPRPGQLV